MLYDYLVDTDVLIWYLRGNEKAYKLIHSLNHFCISSITYMELVQGMRNKEVHITAHPATNRAEHPATWREIFSVFGF